MKLIIFAVTCLFVLISVSCTDQQFGEREEGDILVKSHRFFGVGVPGLPMVRWYGFNNDTYTITAINAVNAPESDANVRIVKGGIGTGKVVLMAISEPGAGMNVQLDIYATPNEQTTVA